MNTCCLTSKGPSVLSGISIQHKSFGLASQENFHWVIFFRIRRAPPKKRLYTSEFIDDIRSLLSKNEQIRIVRGSI